MITLAIVQFCITYVLLISFEKHRSYIAAASAAIYLSLGILPFDKVMAAIDWNVLLMICGTMGLVALFIESKMPSLLADLLMSRVKTVLSAILCLCIFSGLISACLDNVATVLMVAPVALAICKKQRINPVPVIIGIAVSSNLQGAATLVGDTTSILLGGFAHMDFMDFFFINGKPGIFFTVETGALLTILVLWGIFRKERRPVESHDLTQVEDKVPTIFLISNIVLLMAASFIPHKPAITNGLICVTLLALCLIYELIRTRNTKLAGLVVRKIDWQTLLLLGSLFIIIGAMQEVGLIDTLASLLSGAAGGSVFVAYTIIVWGSVLLSAFIDNIPYVATMLPVVTGTASLMGIDPTLFYFGLLTGATLGGNLSPIGASANITGIGILRKEGYRVSVGDFARIGVPFTLVAVTVGYLLIWLIWA